jgi:hypothetical protein
MSWIKVTAKIIGGAARFINVPDEGCNFNDAAIACRIRSIAPGQFYLIPFTTTPTTSGSNLMHLEFGGCEDNIKF